MLNALLEEYEVVAQTFDVIVPAPNTDAKEATLTFKTFRTTAEANAVMKQAREMSNACLLYGDPKAEENKMYGPIKDRLPETREDALRIALMTLTVTSEPIPFLAMVRLCSNWTLFDYLWGEWNDGQKTVNAKHVDTQIAKAKKKLQEAEGLLSVPSETSVAQKPSSKSTRGPKKPSSGN